MKKIIGVCAVVGVLAAAAACDRTVSSPDTGNNNQLPAPPTGFVVSDPHALTSAAIAPGATSLTLSAAGQVVYVSAEPGTLPDAVSARIQGSLTGAKPIIVTVLNGGFDPVAVPGTAGEQLTLTLVTADGKTASFGVSVPPRRPPIVIRTNPAKGRTDVALTQVVTAVFSEPVDPRTVNATSVKLLKSGQPISAGVSIESNGWAADIAPVIPLEAQTTYTLVVSKEVRDLEGDTLDSEDSVTFTTGGVFVPLGPSSVRVVFQQLEGPTRESSYIYAMNADGSNLVQLTSGNGYDTDPAVSPDGKKIAFVSDGYIFVMNSDGSSPVQLTTTKGSGPAWSPDGTKIVFADDATTGISVIGVDGTGLTHLTDASVADKSDIDPAWSPDGRQIAFMRWVGLEFSVVWIMNSDGSMVRQLGRQEIVGGSIRTWACWSPVWSPDSQRLAVAGPDDGLQATIFTMAPDGSSVSPMLTLSVQSFISKLTDWSSDGKWIAFTESGSGGTDIYLAKGASAIQITNDGRSGSASFIAK